MQYPLDLRFKLLSLTTQIYVTDANGEPVFYVKQKMFRLREKVEVFRDSTRQTKLFEITADRVIDFSANYRFRFADGSDFGSVRRRGMRSLWSAHYDILQDGQIDMSIQEEKPWKRFLESVLGSIPVISYLAIYYINPTYLIQHANGTNALRVSKRPSFFEGHFTIEELGELEESDELRAVLSLIMMVILEKKRG